MKKILDLANDDRFTEAFKINDYSELCHWFQNVKLDKNIYKQVHHIIPRCEGGLNDASNLVELPYYFHIKAHYLHAKELEKENKLRPAYQNYKAVMRCLGESYIPKDYHEFLMGLDFAIESLSKRAQLEKQTFWVKKSGEKSVRIFSDQLEEYEKLGYTKGRDFKNPSTKKWVNKNGKNFYIESSELQKYLSDGYSLGMFKTDKMRSCNKVSKSTVGTKWMHKGTERKAVKKELVDEYLKEGWELGSGMTPAAGAKHPHKKRGMHWFTNGVESIQALECPEGYRRGRVCK